MNSSRKLHFMVFGFVVLIMFLCFLDLRTLHSGDSGGYLVPAYAISIGQLHFYDGFRTPMYPLFLLLVIKIYSALHPHFTFTSPGLSISAGCANAVATLQFIGLLLSVTMLYWTACFIKKNRDALIVAIAAIAVLGFPVTGWFSRFILSEALTCTFAYAALSAIVLGFAWKNKASRWFIYSGFLLLSAGTLTRPNMIVPSVILIFFVVLQYRRSKSPAITMETLGIGAGLFALPILCWMSFNLGNSGYFNLSTGKGLFSSALMTNLWDRVPEKHKAIAEIVKKYRGPAPYDCTAVHRAYPELREKIADLPIKRRVPVPWTAGVDISKYLEEVIYDTARENPGEVFKGMGREFPCFFDTTFGIPIGNVTDPVAYGGGDNVRYPKLYAALYFYSKVSGGLITLLDIMAFVVVLSFGMYATVRLAIKRKLPDLDGVPLGWLGIGSLFAFVFGQLAFLMAGYYDARYTLPYLPFLFLGTILLASPIREIIVRIVRRSRGVEKV